MLKKMFDVKRIFGSKKRTLAQKWTKEHKVISNLFQEIAEDYKKKETSKTREKMIKLRTIFIDHILSEDIEIRVILRGGKRESKESIAIMIDFQNSFRDPKTDIRAFLGRYTSKHIKYDETFYLDLRNTIEIFERRAKYEEENLYKHFSLN